MLYVFICICPCLAAIALGQSQRSHSVAPLVVDVLSDSASTALHTDSVCDAVHDLSRRRSSMTCIMGIRGGKKKAVKAEKTQRSQPPLKGSKDKLPQGDDEVTISSDSNSKDINPNSSKGSSKGIIDHSSGSSSSDSSSSSSLEDDGDASDMDTEQYDAGASRSIPLMSKVLEIWHKTPPITQVYVGSSLMITLLSFALNGNKWPELLHFDWQAVLTGQIWRLFSAFLFFGQLDMFYPLTMQFVWQHMSQLEKLNYNKPEDFLVMVLFGAGSLIGIYSLMGISMKFLGHNLATFLVYIWSRVFEGSDINFMDIVTLKSEMLPWFFCIQTFVLEREIPFADLIGIVVGHLYYYLSSKGSLQSPALFRSWFESDYMRNKYARFKNDFE